MSAGTGMRMLVTGAPRARTRVAVAVIAAAVATWVSGCGDSARVTDVPEPVLIADSMPIVSDPVAGSLTTSASFASFAPQAGDAGSDIAYVSLRPGTVPTAESATIRRRGSTNTVTGAMEDGGLDPLPIAAAEGDTVDIEVHLTGGTSVRFAVRVPVTRRPRVVRTYPPPKKRDVALNARIVVVFTEPVAAATLTPSSVQLSKSGSAVAGTVRLLEGTTAAAVFEPSAPLDPNTEYRLIVTEAVRDLAGDVLEGRDTVTFATGTTFEGAVASIRVAPDSAHVLVGSQLQLTAIASDADGTVVAGRAIRWASWDTAVATISAAGLVTAVAEGTTLITAEVDGQTGGLDLTVSATLTRVASVTLTPEAGRVVAGGTLVLEADPRDSAGGIVQTPRVLSWSSSNPAVATVAASSPRTALVRGVTDGVARIAVTVDGASDTSVVTVGPPLPSVALVLSPDPATVVLRGTLQLTGHGKDAGGGLNPVPGGQIAWTSSNPSIVSVDDSGLVTARSVGSAAIEGAWTGYRDTLTVTVVALSFTQITAGGSHTCGITPNGAAYCWGYGWDGQLGTGTQGSITTPTAVAGGLTFATVDVHWNYSCGLTSAGAAYCWGLNYAGRERCPNGGCSVTPVAAAGGLTFTALSAGGSRTCGLISSGAAYCWEGLDWSKNPIAVAGGRTFASITAGASHACALTAQGVAFCWGSNYHNQLGATAPDDCDGGPCSRAPIAVAGGLTFTALSAGESHTCGLTSTGAVYCWGVPAAWGGGGSATPAPVMGLTFVGLSSSKAGYTCGLVSSGAVHCWDDWGSSPSRNPWTVPGAPAFAALSAGEGYGCAVTSNRVGYCWGRNDMGQLGIGTTSDYIPQPMKVGGQP